MGLNELEAAIMDVLRIGPEPIEVRDVLGRLDSGTLLAYTPL